MFRFRTMLLVTGFTIGALALAACGGATPTAAPTTAPPTGMPATAMPTAAPTAAASSGAAATDLQLGSSSLGQILVDSQGMTLYMLSADSSTNSVCTGGCATNWPPLSISGTPTVGSGLDASMLGSLTRADGSTQVTYNGHPLYHFKGDAAPGDVKGEGLQFSGGTWTVLDAQGNPVSPSSGSTGGSSTASAQMNGY